MEIVNTIVESEIFDIILKLLLSALLAGFIGIERTSLNKPAGFGTHAIIGLSAALVVMSSQYMAIYYNIDASRIPSQIIAGIGFIGAGTILRNGFNVRGVTTAAGILSVTCIGIAVGMGYYVAAVVATIIVYFVLSVNHDINEKFDRYAVIDVTITVNNDSDDILDKIQKYFKDKKITLQSIRKEDKIIDKKNLNGFRIAATFDSRKISRSEIINSLIAIKDVNEVIDENNVVQ